MSPTVGSRRLLVLLVLAVALAGTAGALQSFDTPTGETVIERTEQRYESAETLTGTATVTVENGSISETATVQFAMAGTKSRTVVTRDSRTYRAGSNGTVAWIVGPNRSAAWPVDSVRAGGSLVANATDADVPAPVGTDQPTPAGLPKINSTNVSATVAGTPTVAGERTYEVALTHPDTAGATTLWVTQDDYRVVRAVATDSTNRTEISVQETVFNASVHESTFDPPADRVALTTVDRYDDFSSAQAATDIELPSLDATFTGATVTTRHGEPIAGQRYERDGANITVLSTTATDRFDRITENATEQTIDGRTVHVTTASDRAIVAWTANGTTTAVVVSGSSDSALAIASDL